MKRTLTAAVLTGIALIGLVACGDKKDGAEKPVKGDDPAEVEAGAASGEKTSYDAAAHKGALTGVVKFGAGTPPAPVLHNLSSEAICLAAWGTKPTIDQQFEVNADGTVPHVFIYPTDGPHKDYDGYEAPTGFVVNQVDCYYVPHVFGVMVGQEFTVANPDGCAHNVHVKPRRNERINKSQPPKTKDTFVFSKKEKAVPFQCDIHSWMSAKAWVMDHPFFATTDATGKFTIEGLPDGEYTFKAWHENPDFGSAEFTVTIAGGEVSETVTLK